MNEINSIQERLIATKNKQTNPTDQKETKSIAFDLIYI